MEIVVCGDKVKVNGVEIDVEKVKVNHGDSLTGMPLADAVRKGRPFKRPGWKLGPGGAIPWVSWCILSRKFVFEDGMNQWNPRPEDIMATDYELREKTGMELLNDFLDCRPEDSNRIREIQDYVWNNFRKGERLEIPF